MWQERKQAEQQQKERQRHGTSKGGRPAKGNNPKGRYESSSTTASPGASRRRECCPYLFQRGMVVSEEGVRGGQDHLRSDEVGLGTHGCMFREVLVRRFDWLTYVVKARVVATSTYSSDILHRRFLKKISALVEFCSAVLLSWSGLVGRSMN